MTGWLADFFRLAGGLLYWNTRKSWFRLRRGRSLCPCQSPSDSGRAMETRCEANIHWASAERFRSVCPLLVKTPEGWRCSVNTADVRPFWGRAFRYYGGALAAVYLTAVICVFIFLRLVGYPVNVFHVAWPPAWHRVGEARGWFFMEKARHAFAANRTSEAILYLSNAYEFDPSNYAAGLTLAKTLQSGQPVLSNRVYANLLHQHPTRRDETAQEWFRALLARGDFETISILARDEVLAAGPHTSVWMRAVVFAGRQSHSDIALRALRDSTSPAALPWRPLLDTELLLQSGHTAEAHTFLTQGDWRRVPPYGIYYQVSQLTEMNDVFAALDLLAQKGAAIDDETRVALQLAAYSRQGADRPLRQLVSQLLASELNQPVIKLLSAHLIRYPDPAFLARLHARFSAEQMPFNTDTASAYFSLLCAAGVNADWPMFSELRATITTQAGASSGLLAAVEDFFRGRSATTRITSFLPGLPLPLEVNYALIERYPGPPSGPALSKPAKAGAPALSPPNGSNGPDTQPPALSPSKGLEVNLPKPRASDGSGKNNP